MDPTNNLPTLGTFTFQPPNGYDQVRYVPPANQDEARQRGRVERQADRSDIVVEDTNETPQVRFLLDLFCYLSFGLDNRDVVENPGLALHWEYTTHKDIKEGWGRGRVDRYFFSNNRAVQRVLEEEFFDGFHWGGAGSGSDGPRTRSTERRSLRFHDTDSNDWSQTAEDMIDLMLAGRIWRVDYSEYELADFYRDSGFYRWDDEEQRWRIEFLD